MDWETLKADCLACSRCELCKTRTLNKLRAPKDLKLLERRKMHYSDTDVNGHVNNTRYADFACDAVELDKLPPEQFLAEMQIGYLAECRPGEILDLEAGSIDSGCYVQFHKLLGGVLIDHILQLLFSFPAYPGLFLGTAAAEPPIRRY